MHENNSVKELNLPKLNWIGKGFLRNNLFYNNSLRYKLIKMIISIKKQKQKLLKLEKKKNGR